MFVSSFIFCLFICFFFFFQAEDGIRDATVTGVQTCALPIFLRLDLSDRESEGPHGREQPGGILDRGTYEDIEIAREARSTMKSQRVRSDDDEFDVMGDQRCDEFVEVGRQVHGTASGGTRRLRCGLPGAGTTNTGAPAGYGALRRTRLCAGPGSA